MVRVRSKHKRRVRANFTMMVYSSTWSSSPHYTRCQNLTGVTVAPRHDLLAYP